MSMASTSQLRRHYAQQRRTLAPSDAAERSRAIAMHCLAAPAIQRAVQIASYIALPGEVQTTELNTAFADSGATVHAPVVRGKHMYFAPLRDPLRRAPTGNWQPRLQHVVWLHQLDVVLLPLLAFDAAGNRLGMGGGYYDRCLAAQQNRSARRPLRVGLAYDCQRADTLPAQPWDVPLHAVVTESGWMNLPASVA